MRLNFDVVESSVDFNIHYSYQFGDSHSWSSAPEDGAHQVVSFISVSFSLKFDVDHMNTAFFKVVDKNLKIMDYIKEYVHKLFDENIDMIELGINNKLETNEFEIGNKCDYCDVYFNVYNNVVCVSMILHDVKNLKRFKNELDRIHI